MSDPAEEINPQFSYNIFLAIKDAQIKNGIRISDYERYRQYCTRRLRRIRKSLKIIHGRKKYQKKNFDIKNISDVRYIELILFYAERAWAYALDLKSEVENPRAKYHSQSKFVKAHQYTEQLKEMCNSCADEKTKIQADTYCEWMKANLAYEKNQWAKAFFHYNRSLAFFTELSNATRGEEKEIYTSKIEEIKTLVNFCRTNLTKLNLDFTEKFVEENEIDEIRKNLEKLSFQEEAKPVETEEKSSKDKIEARLRDVIKRSYIDLSLKEGKKVDEAKSSELPQLIPMPCKPVLFDLALSTYERPNLEEKMKAPKSIFSFW